MELSAVNMMPKSTAEVEKEMETERLVQSVQPSGSGFSQAAKRRASRPMLWLGNISALPYQVIRTVVWPSSRKTSET